MIRAALDCSLGCALAIRQDQTLLCSEFLPGASRESDRFLSQWLVDCFQRQQLEVTDVQHWTAGTGPGSFAGLRCGIALLKGICQTSKAHLRGVPSCYALARNISDPQAGQHIGVLHDGRCGQVILTRFTVTDDLDTVWQSDPVPLFPEELLHKESLCDRWICLNNLQLPELPAELLSALQQVDHLNAAFLLEATAWPWPNNPAEQEKSCEPLYVRQAVFVKPAPLRT
ncbi:MAG: tRNA (adenosine(37)-N6)-threonylcarbamoyltransferase complex dimerization subunit type 1 TsaB [Lentisphaeria bacterium]